MMNKDDDDNVVVDVHATCKDHNERIYTCQSHTLCMNLLILIIFHTFVCMKWCDDLFRQVYRVKSNKFSLRTNIEPT